MLSAMYQDQFVFSQIMDLPWILLTETLPRQPQGSLFDGSMAIAQLTQRTSLRFCCVLTQKNCTTSASPTASKSTLAKANEQRNWRIHADFAQRLIASARCTPMMTFRWIWIKPYALDSSTIGLSLFPWARFALQNPIKLHTMLERGNIPTFVEITEAKLMYS